MEGDKEMIRMAKYLSGWIIGMLTFKWVVIPFVMSVGASPLTQLEYVIWPIVLWTIAWSVIFGIIISDPYPEAKR